MPTKSQDLIRELEGILHAETTTTANVATVAVPLGGQAPGAVGGSIKPWGDWDNKGAKEKKLKDFNKRLAANKMPVREQSKEDDAIRGTVQGTDEQRAAWEHDQDSDVTHCAEQPRYDDGRDAWACDACGYKGPNGPVKEDQAGTTKHGHGAGAFPDVARMPMRDPSQWQFDLEDLLPPRLDVFPAGEGQDKGGTPMMRRPFPVGPQETTPDDGTQPYAQLAPPKKRKDESLGAPPVGLLTEAHEGSVWVAILLPSEVQQQLAKYKVGEADDDGVGLHITLAYLGKRDQFTDQQIELMRDAVRRTAEVHAPLEFMLTGSGKFGASEQSDGKVPVIIIPSARGLAGLRTDIVRAMVQAAGIKLTSPFDFVPHICIGYVADPEIQAPAIVKGEVTWKTDAVTFFVNPDREVMPLGTSGNRVVEDTDPGFDYLWTCWPGKKEQLGPEVDYAEWLERREKEADRQEAVLRLTR